MTTNVCLVLKNNDTLEVTIPKPLTLHHGRYRASQRYI